MIRTIWVTWVNFLVGQVGLIHKPNYLDVTWIFNIDHKFFRKRHWQLISEWTLGLMKALNHHWYETSLLPQAILKYVVARDFILKNSVHGTSSVSWRNLWHCFTSDFSMSFYITFKKKTLACGSQEGHMWITSRFLYGLVHQVGQQVWPTFNPGLLADRHITIKTY